MPKLRCAAAALVVGVAAPRSAVALPPLRILSVDASPAVDRTVPALRVTLAEDVSWGTMPCAAPSTAAVCARPAPPRPPTSVALEGGPESAPLAREAHHVPTAWLVVVDAGAPITPRWQDVRTAAFAWLDEAPRPGDRVAVVMLGETRHVSRTPWFSYESRDRAREALGFQSLPLMALGRDEALGPVFRVAVAEALRDLPTVPSSEDVPRVVVGLFSDGRTTTAQAAFEEKVRSGHAPALPVARRTRSYEVEAFWFPHDRDNPRAHGTGGMLDVTRERGRVTRFDAAPREAAVREAAARARAVADRAYVTLLEAPRRNLFPGIPSIELRDDRGGVLDATGPLTMPLEREAWPLPRVPLALDDLPSFAFAPPLPADADPVPRWRAFWLPLAEAPKVLPPAGQPIARATLETLVATDRELTLTASEARLHATLESAAMLERASGPLAIVVYDDTSGRATPMRPEDAPLIPQGTWTAPLVDGLRVLRLAVLAGSLVGLAALVRWRKRRARGA